MRYFTKLIITAVGAIVALSFTACADKPYKGPSDAATKCDLVGKAESCACSDGGTGRRVCLDDGTYTQCICGFDTCTTAGKEFSCSCPNGIDGKRVCLNTGYFTSCSCNSDAPRCCHDLGSCIASSAVAAVSKQALTMLGHDSCPAGKDLLCTPDTFVASEVPALCHSVNDAEGRCMPDCLPDVADQADQLPRDVCPKFHLCVPCLDPLTGFSTQACTLFTDRGQIEPPRIFDKCCSNRGHCVKSSQVPKDKRSYLGIDICSKDDALLCAPDVLIESPTFVPEVCLSIAGSEGRCLPDCLPEVVGQAITLPQDICDDGYRCAPCFHPVTGEKTPACTLSGDPGPVEEPVVFSRCCGNIGACVPQELVSSDLTSYLDQENCRTNQGLLCAPDVFTDKAGYYPPKCQSILNAEGRCQAQCLPDVVKQPIALPQDRCDDKFVCAPCYDPRTGKLTPACTLPNDPGPTDSPVTFDRCCGGNGSCIPSSLIEQSPMAGLASNLGENSCKIDQGLLCTPDVFVDAKSYVPSKCASFGDAKNKGEGRCLPDCLPIVTTQRITIPKDKCADHYVCAPCYNPIDGTPMDTCKFPGDSPDPTKKPYVFPSCCGTDGTCVPSELLDSALAAGLAESAASYDCADTSYVCAPSNVAKGKPMVRCVADINVDLGPFLILFGIADASVPVTLSTSTGACVPGCFLMNDDQRRAVSQKTCGDSEYCVPCTAIDGIIPGGCSY